MADDRIVWLDMEMTGLDPETCHILEIACFVTDKDLKQISSMFHVVINQPRNVLAGMGDWCKEHHKKSGLIKECEASNVSTKDAEERLLKFLKGHVPQGSCPLAGNTIYMDKLFLMKHLPKVTDYLHYRVIDVSSIFELCRRWYPNFKGLKKLQRHRAINDVQESLAQLRHLRKNFFKKKNDALPVNESFDGL